MDIEIIDYTTLLETIIIKLDNLSDLQKGLQTLTFVGGVIIALMLVNLFAKAWGRNL